MIDTTHLILVCTGRDTVQAAARGLPVLHLCLSVTENGVLRRTQLPTVQTRCILGISELPPALPLSRARTLAADIAFEAKSKQANGVFADFEQNTPACRALLAALDHQLFDSGMTLYVPVACGQAAPHAVITVSTAISGGSLTGYIAAQQKTYGAARVAAFLQPISRNFPLPSRSPEGILLTESEREELLLRTGSQVFFSRELCAKYFTYTDEKGTAHFVLFDDASTLEAKLTQLVGCGVSPIFALFPDAQMLLEEGEAAGSPAYPYPGKPPPGA